MGTQTQLVKINNKFFTIIIVEKVVHKEKEKRKKVKNLLRDDGMESGYARKDTRDERGQHLVRDSQLEWK